MALMAGLPIWLGCSFKLALPRPRIVLKIVILSAAMRVILCVYRDLDAHWPTYLQRKETLQT
jgi:hypothetical protein